MNGLFKACQAMLKASYFSIKKQASKVRFYFKG